MSIERAHVELAEDAPRAGLRCPQCHAVEWLEAAEDAERGVLPTAPKAGEATPSGPPAKASVALLSTAAQAERHAPEHVATALRGLATADEEGAFVDAFEAVLKTSWHDEEAHKKLASRAQVEGRLALLGRCYKALRDEDEGDEIAKAGQDRVLTLAMASLKPLKDAPKPQNAALVKIVVIVVGLLIMGIAGAWIVRSLQSLQAG